MGRGRCGTHPPSPWNPGSPWGCRSPGKGSEAVTTTCDAVRQGFSDNSAGLHVARTQTVAAEIV